MWNRWLGVGLASCLAVVTLWLAATGRLALYINPSSNWFAVPMAVLLLVGAALSFLLPLGAEADHGHDHQFGGDHAHTPPATREPQARVDAYREGVVSTRSARSTTGGGTAHSTTGGRAARPMGATIGAVGGVAASAVMLSILLLPPASLSAEIAQTRDVGAAPLFAGTDVVNLATRGDTSEFGVGDWASVFATATNPDAFEGDAVTLTGFVTPGDDGAFDLTRLVITHCVIDAQSASVPIAAAVAAPATGVWVEVTGTVRSTTAGALQIAATAVKRIAEPKDPYEY
ncbi:DUF1980 domain-containing protein [Microbacterium protaetiae]|uniref:DUF1980 domain-containing protein n=1 Tax=Microbacterium protaetiae TaxID=2509458 RepID=A0A4P6EJB8_9MICO|nr:DUF1980 domain-containing protein [Microbacterium protaetiae]